MSNVYPNAIRTFPTHQDGRDFVLAADVNEIQDELTGVETAIGTKPQVYTNATGKRFEYKDVSARLDTMQRNGDATSATVSTLVDASKTGWSLPVSSFRGTGTSIRPTDDQLHPNDPKSDWHPITWNLPLTDPLKLCKNSPLVSCPQTGWWIIVIRVLGQIASGPTSLDHFMWSSIHLEDHDNSVATASSTLPRGTKGYHRHSLTYAGEWFQGERLSLNIRHGDSMRVDNRSKFPNPIPNVTVWGWAGLTYIRALPAGYDARRVAWDIDPA
jgi:hypothetical protein